MKVTIQKAANGYAMFYASEDEVEKIVYIVQGNSLKSFQEICTNLAKVLGVTNGKPGLQTISIEVKET